MLGSMMVDVLTRDNKLSVMATLRDARQIKLCKKRYPQVTWVLFDAETQKITDLKIQINWVINCIGVIKPYIHDDNPAEVARAIIVNAFFPHTLAAFAHAHNARVLQIATDCVYSGLRGGYNEHDLHDTLDIYGKTKSLGEVRATGVTHLRCSIIGPELKGTRSLLGWFLSQPANSRLQGFANHHWNGITTLHFARLCRAIIRTNLSLPHIVHVLPADTVSKYELLQIAANAYKKRVHITPVAAVKPVNRLLTTVKPALNAHLWKLIGYKAPPTIKQIVLELVCYDYPFS